jgi:hypothetical protein
LILGRERHDAGGDLHEAVACERRDSIAVKGVQSTRPFRYEA